MSGNIVRRDAITGIISSDGVPSGIPYTEVPTSALFGHNVYSLSVMQNRLPKGIYKSLKETIEAGHGDGPDDGGRRGVGHEVLGH